MEFINTTAVPAHHTVVTGNDDITRRAVMVTAKATFTVDDDGNVALDRDNPLPILMEDAPTPLGDLPRDVLPKMDAGFEVIVLGRAHSPNAAPVSAMDVSLAVGSVHRRLRVHGDRSWVGKGPDAKIGPAEPFLAMAMDWSRALGGQSRAEIDEGAFVDFGHPLNREGRGFDHLAKVDEFAQLMKCPDPFPKFDPIRVLPNLEDPDAPIQAWQDDPLPVSWATVPASSGMLVERKRRRGMDGKSLPEISLKDPSPFERAHPDWIIAPPAAGALVDLRGMTPAADPSGRLTFSLPPSRVTADMIVGDTSTSFEIHPRLLMLLPEERRFYIVFRGGEKYSYVPDEERSVRINLSRGWEPVSVKPKQPITVVPKAVKKEA